jgi:ATP-dependent RNA helicase SUPV3L1/SUV3
VVEAASSEAEAPIASEATDGAPAEAAAAEAKPDTPVVPELVEVWRPGGRSEERRPHHDRNRQRRHGHQNRPQGSQQGSQPASQEGTAPAVAAEGGEAAAPGREQRHRRGRRHNEFRKPREGAPVEAGATPPAEGAPAQEARADTNRPPRERFEGKGRDENRREKFGGDRNKGGDRSKGDRGGRDKGGRDFGGRDKGGRDKRDRDSGPSHRQYATSAAPRDRDRPIDPNSPFAKLAALKEQLAGNRKD